MTYNQKALKQYQSVDIRSAVEGASPHQLISMLLGGALTAIHRAKGLLEQRKHEEKGKQISKASAIVIHLKGALDAEAGGEVAANLDRLYDYILRRLIDAHRNNNSDILDEVVRLLGEVKAGWDAMPETTP